MIMVNSIYWSIETGYKLTTFIFIAIIVLLNLAFMFIFVYFAFRQQITNVTETIVKLKHDLSVLCPKIAKYIAIRSVQFKYHNQEFKEKWKRAMKLLKDYKFDLENIQCIAGTEFNQSSSHSQIDLRMQSDKTRKIPCFMKSKEVPSDFTSLEDQS